MAELKITKQSQLYVDYLEHPEMSLKQLAEKYNISYSTCRNMLHKERVRLGVAIKKRR